VKIGPEHQAEVPVVVSRTGPDPESYHPDYEGSLANCRWSPGILRESEVVDYLKKARVISDDVRREVQDVTDVPAEPTPLSGHVHDNDHVSL
jgi:hypothetical protein